MEPVHCHSDRFFLSHHPIIFIRNAFDLLGCFFNICSRLHPGGRFCIERSTRPEKTFYRVFVSIPALGRQPGTSWNSGVSDAQSPAHFALCFYLSILSSALCIQPDLASLFFGLVLLFHLSWVDDVFLPYIFVTYFHWTVLVIALTAIVKQSRYYNIFLKTLVRLQLLI